MFAITQLFADRQLGQSSSKWLPSLVLHDALPSLSVLLISHFLFSILQGLGCGTGIVCCSVRHLSPHHPTPLYAEHRVRPWFTPLGFGLGRGEEMASCAVSFLHCQVLNYLVSFLGWLRSWKPFIIHPWGAMLTSHITISCMVLCALSPPALCTSISTPLRAECWVVPWSPLVGAWFGAGFRNGNCVRWVSFLFLHTQLHDHDELPPVYALHAHAPWRYPHVWTKQPKWTTMHALVWLARHLESWRWPG